MEGDMQIKMAVFDGLFYLLIWKSSCIAAATVLGQTGLTTGSSRSLRSLGTS